METAGCERCGKEHAGCTAHARTGKACKFPPIRGGFTCRFHGGRAPQVLLAAERRLVERDIREEVARSVGAQLTSWGVEPTHVDPADALLDLVRGSAAAVGALAALVARYDELTTLEVAGEIAVREVVRPEVALWNDERDRLARISALAIRAGIEERRVRLAEADVSRLITAVIAAIDDPTWGLTNDQRARGLEVVAAHFQALPPA